MRRTYFISAILVAFALLPSSDPLASSDVTGRASVVDGDTLEIQGHRIRLHGIDAPESSQKCLDQSGQEWRCGQKAAFALADRIGQSPVYCEGLDTDGYGRMVSVCRKGNEDLNAWMVKQGWAVAYRKYSEDYVSLEKQAQEASRNIWAGDFVKPWSWRRGERLGALGGTSGSETSPLTRDCNIKGNINREGVRIFHMPSDQYYGRTRINSSRGERWFCSEKEARDAGWRRARR
ncbi:thermonuclease family protein [Fodinicurvata fenggangensis]|uniref:thermonuclease family protein n=1 Tax=Fodinicurvata fenggangensis TaxID=1121830 RepID=UPI00047B2725|nr:thermonuclease family protein [Fodinicurvata fenggangensis]